MRNKLERNLLLARKLNSKRIPFIPRLITNLNRILFSCDIPLSAEIADDVQLVHNGLGVVINPKAKIGKGTRIMQNVTIGTSPGKRRMIDNKEIDSPIIGENVYIGAGAILIGPILIGNNAKIGSGAVVMIDVPEYGLAVGVPAKIVKIYKP